jgi:glutamate-ammonia-ligase adenylyltransferase
MKPLKHGDPALPVPLVAALADACADIDQRWSEQQLAQLHSLLTAELEAELAQVLACSPWAGQQFAYHPALLLDLLASGDLHRSYGVEHWREAMAALSSPDMTEDAMGLALRRLRQREQCRLIWRDMNRLDDLQGITADLSALADHSIDTALALIYRLMCADLGTPCDADGVAQRLVVLGMGKLGALELNLSSDVDLMFAFPESGETVGGRRTLSNQDFFIRLARRLIAMIDARTGEGFVFRVDMRLRPYGESGALALSFDALQQYYLTQGRDWERYAMIKARVVAGDQVQGAVLLSLLRPFVYRRYVDFSAIESLRAMKSLIMREVVRLGKQDDVKLGAGGIREVEFIGQVFQLIRGGREPLLQQRALLAVLDCLREQGYLPESVVSELQQAYGFLRNSEHAIQGLHDQQTQALPTDSLDRARVAWVMGFHDWLPYRAVLAQHRDGVREHFAALIASPEHEDSGDDIAGDWYDLWAGAWPEEAAQQWLGEQGYGDPAEVYRRLAILRGCGKVMQMQVVARERLDAFMPLLLAEWAQTPTPDLLLERELPLIEAILRRTAYLVLLMENKVAREQLHILCAASPWVANQLARHPSLLDELHNVATLYRVPELDELSNELREQLMRLDHDDLEGHMNTLRYFRLAHVLSIAASEVTGRLPLMKVSDYLTSIAEVILEHVLRLAWRDLTARHGVPLRTDGTACELDFIIVGYGKLGGIELGHASDLDLVFVHDADPNASSNGPRPVPGQVFFIRLGQRIIHILTTPTTLGELYEVDMRLRPSGESGLLASSLQAYGQYQLNEAWTWEHQALVRARVVAGSESLAAQYETLRRSILQLPRDIEELRKEVSKMRAKMRDHLLPAAARDPENHCFHLKHGSGGIVDIEFMVQFMVLAWGQDYPSLTRWTDNIRILEALAQTGLLSAGEAEGLMGAYKAYRASAHLLALRRDPVLVSDDQFGPERALVSELWQRLLLEPPGPL